MNEQHRQALGITGRIISCLRNDPELRLYDLTSEVQTKLQEGIVNLLLNCQKRCPTCGNEVSGQNEKVPCPACRTIKQLEHKLRQIKLILEGRD